MRRAVAFAAMFVVVMTGPSHAVSLRGDAGQDRLTGTTGPDRIVGRGGPDRLDGGGGHDLVDGGSGGDLINADASDHVRGGPGNDVVRLTVARRPSFRVHCGSGRDLVSIRTIHRMPRRTVERRISGCERVRIRR